MGQLELSAVAAKSGVLPTYPLAVTVLIAVWQRYSNYCGPTAAVMFASSTVDGPGTAVVLDDPPTLSSCESQMDLTAVKEAVGIRMQQFSCSAFA